MDEETLKSELIKAGHDLKRQQLTWGTSGNISARIDSSHMIITCSGTNISNLQMDEFTRVDLETSAWEGKRKPSKEVPMHSAIYHARKDAAVVLHSSPFYTTLFAASKEPIVSELFIEAMYYLEDVAYVDYQPPGSRELGESVGMQADKGHIIMLKNHGVILFENSISEALMRLETLEMACRMIVTARAAGIQLDRVPDYLVKEFLESGSYKKRKKIK
ncbi:class II aldolase/adducin family protein [Sporolactobacillus nakayamae]|uniref:L-fuculose-phosphate aldolase n=1 Tax=Sporolactobacillus nakayamae TaxID=269670 RepID=A0A1I2UDV7_9BACL|nr:class II aldolase/adducin family protein [Sporolactobacillus nakayamae]SFG75228.1 L-fuculose-phosphate aldolase [Sporolactobacillus nakayamae]